MSFWNTERIKKYCEDHQPDDRLVVPYNENRVKHGAYELAVGEEVNLTSADDGKKEKLEAGDPVVIPPGQLAMILTEEIVNLPPDVLGLISMRFSIKRKGLINVSGFHVDPGYKHRLKFSVYNAGSQLITLQRGDPVFMIWFADFNGSTVDLFKPDRSGDNDTITSADQNDMHGEIASPAQLKKDIEELRHWYGINKTILLWILALLGAIFVRILFMPFAYPWQSSSATVNSATPATSTPATSTPATSTPATSTPATPTPAKSTPAKSTPTAPAAP